jgi:hypothetical protein
MESKDVWLFVTGNLTGPKVYCPGSKEVSSNSRMNCCSPLSSKMVSVETVFNSSKGLSPIICLKEGKEIFSYKP